MQKSFENKTQGDFRFFDSRQALDFEPALIDEIKTLVIPRILAYANESDFQKINLICERAIEELISGLKAAGFLNLERFV